MKKINYKKVLTAVLWITAIAGLAASLGFASANQGNTMVKSLQIGIGNSEENAFLTEADVRKFFDDRNDKIVSNKLKNINIPELEKALNAHPAIENAEVSQSMNGEVKVEITQRTPVVRIINKNGESYYIDSQSKLMPLSDNFSARVIVASGEIFEPYARRYQLPVSAIIESKTFCEVSVLDDIYKVVSFINNDAELSALIHQIYVNSDHELELFPAVGNHKIVFGDGNDIAVKFNKLKLFYTQGLNKSDTWNKYGVINLKYKDQVVCTKR